MLSSADAACSSGFQALQHRTSSVHSGRRRPASISTTFLSALLVAMTSLAGSFASSFSSAAANSASLATRSRRSDSFSSAAAPHVATGSGTSTAKPPAAGPGESRTRWTPTQLTRATVCDLLSHRTFVSACSTARLQSVPCAESTGSKHHNNKRTAVCQQTRVSKVRVWVHQC